MTLSLSASEAPDGWAVRFWLVLLVEGLVELMYAAVIDGGDYADAAYSNVAAINKNK